MAVQAISNVRKQVACETPQQLATVSAQLHEIGFGDVTIDCSRLNTGGTWSELRLADITPDIGPITSRAKAHRERRADQARTGGKLNITVRFPVDPATADNFALRIHRAALRELRLEAPVGQGMTPIAEIRLDNSTFESVLSSSLAIKRLWIRETRVESHLVLAAVEVLGECRLEHVVARREFTCPRECGHLFIRRSRLGGLEASGTTVLGLASVERSSIEANGIAVHGSQFRRGLSFRDCRVNGPVRLSRTRLPYLVIEDCHLEERVRVRLRPLRRDAPDAGDCPGARWSTTVSLSRSVFEGPVLLGEELGPHTSASNDAPVHVLRVFAASARFDAPTSIQCGVYRDSESPRPTRQDEDDVAAAGETTRPSPQRGGPALGSVPLRPAHLLLQRCSFGGDVELDLHGNSALADLAGCRVAEGELSLRGRAGTPSLICLDEVTTPVLRIERFGLQECRLDRLHTITLKLSSDVRFDRPSRPHTEWWLRALARKVRHPLAREVFDERATRARMWRPGANAADTHAMGPVLVDATHKTGPVPSGYQHRWLAQRIDTETPLQRIAPHHIDGTGWEGLNVRRRGIPSTEALRVARELNQNAMTTLAETETLARVYGQLAGAFDAQGDMTLTNDFAWQHLRWRRKFVGQLAQRDRYLRWQTRLDELKREARQLTEAQSSWKVRRQLRKNRRYQWRRRRLIRFAAGKYGGLNGSHLALRTYQHALGSGSRSRSVLATMLAVGALMTSLAAIGLVMAGSSSLSRIPDACQEPTAATFALPTLTVSQAKISAAVAPEQPSPERSNECSDPSLVEWGTDSLLLATSALVPTVPLPGGVVTDPSPILRIYHGLGHVVGALLIAALILTLRAKVRVRSPSRI